MSLNLEYQLNWNVPRNGISLKLKCHSNWNVTQIGMSLKFYVTQIERLNILNRL